MTMTFQQTFEKLQKEYAEASNKFILLDKELSETNGFGNLMDAPDYRLAHTEMQEAGNNYNNFLSMLRGKTFDPNEEYRIIP